MPPNPSEQTLAEALAAARSIFAQGPTGNPRAVLQAHNSFQARWAIIQQRKFAKLIRADVLAAILVLQYAWPKLFEQIFNYPELFFYLHALIKPVSNEKLEEVVPNKICTETEIQEVFELGLPFTTKPTALAEGLGDPDLARLLRALIACPEGVEHLVSHITLMPATDRPAATGVHLNIPAASLLSGDPVLIKFAVRTDGGWNQQVPILSNSLSSLRLDTSGEDLHHAIKVVFALGRLRDERILPALIQLAHSADRLPVSLVLRVIYALAHQASTGHVQAFSELLELLKKSDLSDAIRMRVARVLKYCESSELAKYTIREQLTLLNPEWPTRTSEWLRLSVRESLRTRPGQALRALAQPKRLFPDDLLVLCATATSKSESWPWWVARYLISLVKRPDSVGDHAFTLLQGVADQASRVRWLIWVILTTERSRSHCLDLASEAQGKPDYVQSLTQLPKPGKATAVKESGDSTEPKLTPWQGRAWRLLAQRLSDEKREELLIDALGKTNHTEAVQMLRDLYDSISETRIREQIRQALTQLGNNGVCSATEWLTELDSVG